MLESIKRWMARKGIGHPFPAIVQWATSQGWDVKARPEGDGLIIDSRVPGDTWRLEWGPSQRPYIQGFELRLRAPLADGDAVHMLVMSRRLMQALDAELFKQYTDDLQTRADSESPDEMRWLVLYPKLSGSALGALRERFGGAGHPVEAVAQWVGGASGGALAQALGQAGQDWLAAETPLVLIVQRGRLTLRMPLAQPERAAIEPALDLLRIAHREARLTIERFAASGTAPSTAPSLWTQAEPSTGEAPRR